MSENIRAIEDRVTRTLARLGYGEIRVIDLGDGHVQVALQLDSSVDRTELVAAAGTVPGVTKVSIDVAG
jgi:hypothetical protein